MNNKDFLYRPNWTCGRYDEKSKSAIYYNLIEGMSYFFEDYSAVLIGSVLSYKRGDHFTVQDLALKTGIAVESIIPFLYELREIGLISDYPMADNIIFDYRKKVFQMRRERSVIYDSENNPPVSTITAEREYANRCKCNVISMMLELTYNCTEKCVHCYNPGATRNEHEKSRRGEFSTMSLGDYKRIIDELYEEGMVKVCLSGGDPFSNPHVWDIIDYLYSKEIAIEIYTNGQTLCGNEERLAKYFPCDVGLSIYSSDSTVHDKITRINGSWKRTMSVLNKLSALSVPIEIKCCIMRLNFSSYYGVLDIAKRYAAYLQLECSIFDSFDGDRCVSKHLRLSPKQMEIILCDVNNPLYVGALAENYGRKPLYMDDNGCRTGYQTYCIIPNGNLVLCCSFHASLGNLKQTSLKRILEYNTELDKWRRLTLRSYEECGRHSYCDFCKLCPGLNFSEHGTPLKAAENNCYIAKIRYELFLKLRDGYDPLHGKTLKESLKDYDENYSIKLKQEYGENNLDKELCL